MPQPEDPPSDERDELASDDAPGSNAGEGPAEEELESVFMIPIDGPQSEAEGPAPEPTGIGEADADPGAIEDLLAVAHGPANPESMVAGSQTVLEAIEALHGEVPKVMLGDEDSEGGGPLVNPSASEARMHLGSRGHYQVLGEIARGGMGVVLKGRDTDLGRDVALKVLHMRFSKREEVLQRFVEEAQIGGQLQHPGIVPVYELGLMADDRPYFTMKLVKGRTLASLLAERKSVDEDRRRFVSVFLQVCHTMAYAHSRNVIHRDLKPANVMVGAFAEVQVVDWGLAKVIGKGGVADERKARASQLSIIETVRSADGSTGSHSMVGSVMGTPAYMPPEQARGEVEHLDERSDVFSLGAILCEILTGKPPYAGPNQEALEQAAQADLTDALAALEGCGAHPDLCKIARDCLVPSQQARPSNAKAIAQALEKHLESVEHQLERTRIAAAREKGRAEAARKAHRITSMAGAGVSAALLVALFFWMRAAGDRRKALEESGRASLAAAEAETQRGLAEKSAEQARAAAAAAEQARAEMEAARDAAKNAQGEAEAASMDAEQFLALAEQRAYRAALSAAAAAMEHNDSAAVKRFLGGAPEELRGLEHDLLMNAAFQQLGTQRSDMIQGAGSWRSAIDPRASRYAIMEAVSGTSMAYVHDLASGDRINFTPGWSGNSASLTLSPDGRWLALAQRGTSAADVYDLSRGGWRFGARSSPYRTFLGFHPDGERAAFYRDDGIVVLELETGNEQRLTREGQSTVGAVGVETWMPRAGAFHPDGRHLVVGGAGSSTSWARVLDLEGGEVVGVLPSRSTRRVVFSDDAQWIALLDANGAVAVVQAGWSGPTTFPARWWNLDPLLPSVDSDVTFFRRRSQATGEGQLCLASGNSNGVVQVRSFLNGTWRETGQLRGNGEAVRTLAFDRARDHLVSIHSDGEVLTWDALRPGDLITGARQRVHLFLPDERTVYLSAKSSNNVTTPWVAQGFDYVTGERLDALPHFAVTVAHGADGTDLALSPDGRRIAAVDRSWWGMGRLKVFDRHTGRGLHRADPDIGDLGSVAWSPDGHLLVVGGMEGPPTVYDGDTYAVLGSLEGHGDKGQTEALTFSPDGASLVTVAGDGRALLWNPGRRTRIRQVSPQTDTTPLRSLAFSPDGRMIALGAENGLITVVAPSGGKVFARFAGHTATVEALAFDPESRRLVSASADRSLRIWETESFEELVALRTPNEVTQVSLTPEAVVVGFAGGFTRFYDLVPESERAVERRTDRDARRVAEGVVARLLATEDDPAAVRARIEADTTLTPIVRSAALRLQRADVHRRASGPYLDLDRLDEIALGRVMRFVLENQSTLGQWFTIDMGEVEEELAARGGLTPQEREAAIEWAWAQRGHVIFGGGKSGWFNRLAWRLAVRRGASAQDVRVAIAGLRERLEADPGSTYLLLTLAICLQRDGQHAEVRDTLAEYARSMDGDDLLSQAFFQVIGVLSKHGLGNEAAARKDLASLEALLASEPFTQGRASMDPDELAQMESLAAEARGLLGGVAERSGG